MYTVIQLYKYNIRNGIEYCIVIDKLLRYSYFLIATGIFILSDKLHLLV